MRAGVLTACGLAVAVALAGTACESTSTPGPRTTAPGPRTTTPQEPTSDTRRPPAPDPVRIAAAGDIGSSPTSGEDTARLVRRLRPDAVVTLGDNAYDDGTLEQFRANYHPTWGAFRSITRPAPGNHEYHTAGAAGYFHYFRHQVHGRAYYAWDAGRWRMYSLNCEIACGAGSRQLAWLRADLRSIGQRPALGYVHEPPFSCAFGHDPDPRPLGIWRALQRANGRILLTGHDHAYERFAPMRADGTRAPGAVREFVVGTGGAESYPLKYPCAHRQAQSAGIDGVLELTLGARGYGWRFVGVDGDVLDSGRHPAG